MKRRRGPKSPAELLACLLKARAFRKAHELPSREAHTGDPAIEPEPVQNIARSLGLKYENGKVG